MIHLIPSHRTRPSDDPIFSLHREATARKAKGDSIINATIGVLLDDAGGLAVLPTAARVVHETKTDDWAAYAPIAGHPAFLEAVQNDLLGGEPRLRATSIAVATPGGSGALRHAIVNFLEAGQALLTTSYFWAPYLTLADEAERKVATFSMFSSDGKLDLDALDQAVATQIQDQGRVLLFINDPCHNPTGYSMHRDEWKALVARLVPHAERAPLTLLVDVAYAAYSAGPPWDHLPELVPLLGKAGLLFAWSASKTFTHYGLRVGALVACIPEEKERAATENALSYSSRGTWSNCNAGGLRAITQLLTDPALKAAADAEREVTRKLLAHRVNVFNELAHAKNLRYPRYDGGFFVSVFTDDAAGKAARMRERGVYVVPIRGALRVGLCAVAEKDIPALVDALAM
ncbi:aminotransferase class I/II-fold pyridoxal phosphate-dependent enzyme [Pendulispora brunnea]|uniref:Aminotransferase class I/II-fold pyridoxal phosphate-dependent enzyme n=1 Tax=Pendulispora brunnea TaxID=2905690 RepID=A0ABZ2K8Q7_9BACT